MHLDINQAFSEAVDAVPMEVQYEQQPSINQTVHPHSSFASTRPNYSQQNFVNGGQQWGGGEQPGAYIPAQQTFAAPSSLPHGGPVRTIMPISRPGTGIGAPSHSGTATGRRNSGAFNTGSGPSRPSTSMRQSWQQVNNQSSSNVNLSRASIGTPRPGAGTSPYWQQDGGQQMMGQRMSVGQGMVPVQQSNALGNMNGLGYDGTFNFTSIVTGSFLTSIRAGRTILQRDRSQFPGSHG